MGPGAEMFDPRSFFDHDKVGGWRHEDSYH